MRNAYKILSLSLPPKFSTDEQFICVNNQVVYFNSVQETKVGGSTWALRAANSLLLCQGLAPGAATCLADELQGQERNLLFSLPHFAAN